MKGFKAILYYFLADLFTLLCWAQSKGGQHFGSTVVVSDVNLSNNGDLGSSEPPQTAEGCRGYFDVMGQWDPPFNCSSGEFLYCCGTCGFRYCCKFKQAKLDQSICTNYDRPNWLAPGKTPPKIDDPLHDPNRDKANLIVYIICGVVAVMVLVGIFTKLGLEKAHRPQRENMSRALADVMRQQGHCTADHMERDANLVVHVQHYETMPRSSANNLPKRHINDTPTHLCRITPDLVIGRAPTVWSLAVSITSNWILTVGSKNRTLRMDTTTAHTVGEKEMTTGIDLNTSKINNVVPTSPHLPQMAHPHSYPTMGQISNPYEQQPPGKELNKYASLKAVAEKGNDDFYSKRRHLAELAAKGSLPLHPVRVEQDSPVGGTLKLNGQKSKVNKIHTHPLSSTYNPDYKTWDHTEHSLRRQAYATKKHCPVESVNEHIPSQNQHYIPPQPYFVTNSKTEVTV